MNRQRLDAMRRALAHHEASGAVQTYSPPEPGGRRTWRVRLYGQHEPLDVNTSGLYAMLCGLAAGEQRERAVQSADVAVAAHDRYETWCDTCGAYVDDTTGDHEHQPEGVPHAIS